MAPAWMSRADITLPMGSILGIPVRLHITFLILLACQTLFSFYYGWVYALLFFCLLGPILLLTVLVHELGHAMAARKVGGDCSQILLWPLGGLAFIGHNAGPKADMFVAVAGPLTHIPMVGFWIALLAAATFANTGRAGVSLSYVPIDSAASFFQALCMLSVFANISLFAFNLLVPAYPLDGGRILVGFLLTCGLEQPLVAKIAIGLSVLVGGGLLALGIIVLQLVTILVALFILHAAWVLFDALRTGTLQQHPLFAYGEDLPPTYTPGADNYYKFSPGQI